MSNITIALVKQPTNSVNVKALYRNRDTFQRGGYKPIKKVYF